MSTSELEATNGLRIFHSNEFFHERGIVALKTLRLGIKKRLFHISASAMWLGGWS